MDPPEAGEAGGDASGSGGNEGGSAARRVAAQTPRRRSTVSSAVVFWRGGLRLGAIPSGGHAEQQRAPAGTAGQGRARPAGGSVASDVEEIPAVAAQWRAVVGTVATAAGRRGSAPQARERHPGNGTTAREVCFPKHGPAGRRDTVAGSGAGGVVVDRELGILRLAGGRGGMRARKRALGECARMAEAAHHNCRDWFTIRCALLENLPRSC